MNAAVSIVDTFARSVASGSWGTADTGAVWLNENSAGSVTNNRGTVAIAANDAARTYYIDLDAAGIGKQGTSEIYTIMNWSSSVAYPNTEVGLCLNRQSGTFYYCALQDNWDQVEIGCYIGGVKWQLSNGSTAIQKDTDYWVRFRVTTDVRLKIWRVGTQEPSGWTLTSGLWDGSNPPTTGDCGIYYRGREDAVTVTYNAFYYYTLEDTEPTGVVTDNFDRVLNQAWGVSDSGHTWQGHVGYDYEVYDFPNRGLVADPGDGYGQLDVTTENLYGLIGPRRTTDAEVYAEFSLNSTQGNTFFFPFLRGRLNPVNGVPSPTAYVLRIPTGTTTISLHKMTSGSVGAALATSGAFTALLANTTYSIRFQCTGGGTSTVLRARIWLTSTAEPGTWNVTYNDTTSPITNSGSSGFLLNQSVSTQRQLRVYKWIYQLPTASAPTTQTTVTTLTSSAITDTQISLRANFTGDSTGQNNTISVRYRLTASSDWKTDAVIGTRTSTYWPFNTPNTLVPNTQYTFEVTFADPDGVAGTNPITGSFMTTQIQLSPGALSVTGVTANSISFQGTYSGDSDNDSTATFQQRLSSTTQYMVNDSFDTVVNESLTTHIPQVGSGWTKRMGGDIITNNGRAYVDAAEDQRTVFTANDNPTQNDFTVTTDLRFDTYNISLGIVARYNTATNYYYTARYDATTQTWMIELRQASVTVLAQSPVYILDLNTIYSLSFVVTADYKALFVNGVELIRTTDNTLSAAGATGLYAYPIAPLTPPYDTGSFDNFVVSQRVPGGAFGSIISMTADRPNKKFTATAVGLTSDAVYEFKMTYADPDGVYGANAIQYVSAMTSGTAGSLTTMTFGPQFTTAVVYVNYSYDSNSNSTLAIQYKSTMDTTWTTIPQTSITVNRGIKQFVGIISALKPGMTYSVRATLSDPNGIIEVGISQLDGNFRTLVNQVSDRTSEKQYLWKVFNLSDEYVGTWADAGLPDFKWSLDSGLGECRTTLYRSFASVDAYDSTIIPGYRVDVWATAPASLGLSPNLLADRNFDQGMWLLGSNATISTTDGPDAGRALKIVASAPPVETLSEAIYVDQGQVINFSVLAKARGGKLKIQFRSYDSTESIIEVSNTFSATVGTDWQRLVMDYLPPRNTYYVRAVIVNDGDGTMYAGKPFISKKELLVYRGFIQEYEARIDSTGETVEVTLYSPSTFLADDTVEWLQFASPQPPEDAIAGLPNRGNADPSTMVKALVDLANSQNPRLNLYYSATSIKNTNITTNYTFKDMTFQQAFEAILSLAPLNWHFNIAPDGLVSFFGDTTQPSHTLRLGVEITDYSTSPNIRDIKNYIIVYGTQEDDKNIKAIVFDQPSINTYGRRVDTYTDSGIESDDDAELVAEGRLAQFKDRKESIQATIPDLNSLTFSANQILKGYTIEWLQPGDLVYVRDPVAQPEDTMWDHFSWDIDSWDQNLADQVVISTPVPITSISYRGEEVTIELAEQPPSHAKAYARLWKYTQEQQRKQRLGVQ